MLGEPMNLKGPFFLKGKQKAYGTKHNDTHKDHTGQRHDFQGKHISLLTVLHIELKSLRTTLDVRLTHSLNPFARTSRTPYRNANRWTGFRPYAWKHILNNLPSFASYFFPRMFKFQVRGHRTNPSLLENTYL